MSHSPQILSKSPSPLKNQLKIHPGRLNEDFITSPVRIASKSVAGSSSSGNKAKRSKSKIMSTPAVHASEKPLRKSLFAFFSSWGKKNNQARKISHEREREDEQLALGRIKEKEISPSYSGGYVRTALDTNVVENEEQLNSKKTFQSLMKANRSPKSADSRRASHH
jgi:hypothetical protein